MTLSGGSERMTLAPAQRSSTATCGVAGCARRRRAERREGYTVVQRQ